MSKSPADARKGGTGDEVREKELSPYLAPVPLPRASTEHSGEQSLQAGYGDFLVTISDPVSCMSYGSTCETHVNASTDFFFPVAGGLLDVNEIDPIGRHLFHRAESQGYINYRYASFKVLCHVVLYNTAEICI